MEVCDADISQHLQFQAEVMLDCETSCLRDQFADSCMVANSPCFCSSMQSCGWRLREADSESFHTADCSSRRFGSSEKSHDMSPFAPCGPGWRHQALQNLGKWPFGGDVFFRGFNMFLTVHQSYRPLDCAKSAVGDTSKAVSCSHCAQQPGCPPT